MSHFLLISTGRPATRRKREATLRKTLIFLVCSFGSRWIGLSMPWWGSVNSCLEIHLPGLTPVSVDGARPPKRRAAAAVGATRSRPFRPNAASGGRTGHGNVPDTAARQRHLPPGLGVSGPVACMSSLRLPFRSWPGRPNSPLSPLRSTPPRAFLGGVRRRPQLGRTPASKFPDMSLHYRLTLRREVISWKSRCCC